MFKFCIKKKTLRTKKNTSNKQKVKECAIIRAQKIHITNI